MIETEAKVKLDESDLHELLNRFDFKFESQKNYIYSLPNGYLRVRVDLKKGVVPSPIITFKGSRKNLDFNAREEIQFRCEDLYSMHPEEKIIEFLAHLGFKNPFVYEKGRAKHLFRQAPPGKHQTEKHSFELDILSNGDAYLEVEDEPDKIRSTLEVLGLEKKVIEKKAYHEILKESKVITEGIYATEIQKGMQIQYLGKPYAVSAAKNLFEDGYPEGIEIGNPCAPSTTHLQFMELSTDKGVLKIPLDARVSVLRGEKHE
ncbi:MAG TPA: CYTH domain-containing protein [Candidatus Nanoarchaeia archaeon]|nr:CYTH domain-containing protein [Candidatus Nanoarchaeia archaeon]